MSIERLGEITFVADVGRHGGDVARLHDLDAALLVVVEAPKTV